VSGAVFDQPGLCAVWGRACARGEPGLTGRVRACRAGRAVRGVGERAGDVLSGHAGCVVTLGEGRAEPSRAGAGRAGPSRAEPSICRDIPWCGRVGQTNSEQEDCRGRWRSDPVPNFIIQLVQS